MKIYSLFGWYVELNYNFGHLQTTVLSRLFYSYCCAFYGSQNWRLHSIYFNTD